ncbi:Cysteine-rich protein 2-binding protein, partial [Mortierella polycephala]
SRQFSLSSGSSLSSAGDTDDSLDDDDNFWKSDEEEEFRPVVHLHGIPACIQHHFTPSGLDFSAGSIHLEEIFRLTDLIDENSHGKLVRRVNNLSAMSTGGKKKRRKSSASDIRPRTIKHILDENHYVQDMSDMSDDDLEDDIAGSIDRSDMDSDQSSDGSEESDDLHDARGRAMSATRTAGKRFSHDTTSSTNSSTDRRNSLVPPSSGGKFSRRKSSLKDPMAVFETPRKFKKTVSMADEVDVSYPARVGGGKMFSQAHINAMAKSASRPSQRPRTKAKPKTKRTEHNLVISHSVLPSGAPSGSGSDHLSSTDAVPKPPPVLTLQQLQRQQEWHILQVLEDASKSKALPTVAARFKRKLHLKRLKAFLHLPLFDMEGYMRDHLASPLDLARLSKHIPPDPYELKRLHEEEFRAKIQKIDHTPYGHSFASRLLGQPVECQTRKPWEPLWKSPFSGKVLKDYIWRDYESRAVMMDVLEEIRMRRGRPAKVPWANLGLGGLYDRMGKKRRREESMEVDETDAGQSQEYGHALDEFDQDEPAPTQSRPPIDYCYFRKEHLTQVNEVLCRRFWPGIDMTEALQYPECSVVVLYKRLVVGCAFMTPEGYVTYVAVSAGWEKAGIGQFMLYYLMQASNGKDITLHVSANNPAMIMYQKFGFKPEQFLINFYKEYLPQDSMMCHNAFFVRLRR